MPEAILEELQPMIDTVCQVRNKVCVIVAIADLANDVIDDCAIQDFQSITTMEMLECTPALKYILKQLFIRKPDMAEGRYRYIPASDAPACKSATQTYSTHYKEEVDSQIQSMLANCIIEESSSSWISPAVFIKDVCGLYVDYKELNKNTTHDAYP